MRQLASIFLGVIVLMTPLYGVAKSLNPNNILEDIHHRSPQTVVRDLWKKGLWEDLCTHIETGQAKWIALGFKLKPGTDAGSAESLNIAFAHALTKNPTAVLSRAHQQEDINTYCSAPFIEITDQQAKDYFKQTIYAVSHMQDKRLKPQQQRCLNTLKQAQKTYASSESTPK